MNSKLHAMVSVLAILLCANIAWAETSDVFVGMEVVREQRVDGLNIQEKTIVVGDKQYTFSPLIPIRYSNDNVASIMSLKEGQWVKVYMFPSVTRTIREVSGIEIMVTGDPEK